MMGIINVKDFGAIGDGNFDDTISIQNALDYVSNHGTSLFFPSGFYKVTNNLSLYLTGDHSISLYGEGPGLSVIMLNTGGKDGITINAPGNWWLFATGGSTGFSMSNLTLTTNNNNSGSGIKIIGNSYVGRPMRSLCFTNVEVQGYNQLTQGFAIWFDIYQYGEIRIANCNLRLNANSTGTGIFVRSGSQGTSTSNIEVVNTDFVYGDRGIETGNFFEGLYVSNCGFVNQTYGLYCNVVAESGFNVTNCHFNCRNAGLYLKGMVQANISNCLIYGGSQNEKAGIVIASGSSDIVITGNSIIGQSSDYGIIVSTIPNDNYGCYIGSNYISRFNKTGIWLKSDAKNVRVGDNLILYCSGGRILNNATSQNSIQYPQVNVNTVINIPPKVTYTTIDIPLTSPSFSGPPSIGIISCDSDSRIVGGFLFGDPANTSTNARFWLMHRDCSSKIPSGPARFSVIVGGAFVG